MHNVSFTLRSSFRWWEVQVLAGHQRLASAGRPPAAAALASPPGVHTQPHGGRPDLGPDRPRPGALRASPHAGARWHPSQHEAAGERRDARLFQCLIKKKKKKRKTAFLSVHQLWMRLSGALQKKRTSEISYREVIKNSSNDDTTVAKQVESCLPHFLFPLDISVRWWIGFPVQASVISFACVGSSRSLRLRRTCCGQCRATPASTA